MFCASSQNTKIFVACLFTSWIRRPRDFAKVTWFTEMNPVDTRRYSENEKGSWKGLCTQDQVTESSEGQGWHLIFNSAGRWGTPRSILQRGTQFFVFPRTFSCPISKGRSTSNPIFLDIFFFSGITDTASVAMVSYAYLHPRSGHGMNCHADESSVRILSALIWKSLQARNTKSCFFICLGLK